MNSSPNDSAPCSLGEGTGQVFDWDPDTKDGICVCDNYLCPVNSRNKIESRYAQGTDHPYSGYASSKGVVKPEDIAVISRAL